MLNSIWPLLILISYVYAFFVGNIEKINEGIFVSCSSAVELIITFIGTIPLWSGIMKIAQVSSLTKKISKLLNPITHFLFPEIEKKEKVYKQISLNIVANLLGLGNAATPLGLNAMKSLQEKNKNKSELSNPMAMLILLNTASIQIIPTTVIAIRTNLNSINPTAIIVPVWVSSILAALSGVFTVKLFIKLGK